MKIRIALLAVLIPAILFGGILVSMAAGGWSTTSEKKPATYADGSYAGQYNPADIRGSYTFSEISGLFGIDLDVLYRAFGIPEGTDGTAIKAKDLEAMSGGDTGIGNESIQVFVAFYKGLPIDPGGAVLPEEAVAVILESGSPLPEQLQYLSEYSAPSAKPSAEPSSANAAGATASPAKSGDKSGGGTGSASAGTGTGEEDEQLVKGTTTFQQVLDAGITQAQIESIIGGEMPPANQTVKDYCSSAGLTFSEIKDQLNALVP